MKRRKFMRDIGLGSLLLASPLPYSLTSCKDVQQPDAIQILAQKLLREWCEGMLKHQIIAPNDPAIHGHLKCPACEHIHGRCMDAVYPFLYMADLTGNKKYIDAAIGVMQWAENNVSQPDGSWTVIPNPKSWKGITVFGAIALAEALHHHGHVLPDTIYKSWKKRLRKAADYILKTFSINFTNINYGTTAIYGLLICGKVLEDPKYKERSKQLAADVKHYFTQPNALLWGEIKKINRLSEKGLHGVDLGYNVEESLNSLVQYALEENDSELLNILDRSLLSHAEFMLPDGGWDNSWGTRQNKWSYWGSRTTDGCHMAFAMMANRNPALGEVAYRNTVLLKNCTREGLLYGGPHYISHNVSPCIHHTFTHAKSLTALLDASPSLPKINGNLRLPCEREYGIKEFPEISTWLVSNKSWRATVTSYNAIYNMKVESQQATGGSISVLFHKKAGLLFAASMARYIIVEPNNQQTIREEDFALTPRIEINNENGWFTNLYDLNAMVATSSAENEHRFVVHTQLRNKSRETPSVANPEFEIQYIFGPDELKIRIPMREDHPDEATLVLPLISKNNEPVLQPDPQQLRVQKTAGKIIVRSSVPLKVKGDLNKRVFNLVPGLEAIPIIIPLKPALTLNNPIAELSITMK